MNRAVTTLIITAFSLALSGQSSLEEIFRSSRDFYKIVSEAEVYFDRKYPGLTPWERTVGEHRDGEYVKFMRWRSFWEDRLNADGTLGDPTAHFIEKEKNTSRAKTINPYENVPWTNISYLGYIDDQIGLGRTTSLAFHPTDPNTFYVGAAIGGVWKTTDGGLSYVPLGDQLPFLAISSIIVDQQNPNTIYIAVSDHVWYGPQGIGVYKSTDGGQNWQPTTLSFNFTDDIRIYWLEADPTNPQRMFAATANGLYRTTDGFNSVSKVLNVSSFNVRLKPDDPNIVYVGTRDGRVFRSLDGGGSFTQIVDFGNSEVFLNVTPLSSRKVYARHGSDLYKSTNEGASFTSGGVFPEGDQVFVFSPASPSVILSGNFETFRSNDDGASFIQTMDWLGGGGLVDIHVDQRNMFVNPLENHCVYYCNDGGVYRFILADNSFENLSDGLAITQFYDISVAQSNAGIVGGGSQDNGNVFREANGVWADYAGTGDGMNQDIDPTDSRYRYWSYQNGAVRRWFNGSNSNIEPPGHGNGAWETPYKLDPSNPARIVIAYTEVYESFNRGSNWNSISGALANGSSLQQIAIAPSNGERIYAVHGNKIYVKNTTDDNWTTRNLPANNISDLEVDATDMNKVYVTSSGFTNGSKVFRSDDAGATWINLSLNLPNVSTGAIELYHSIAGAMFVGTDAGVYYKDDYLSEWVEYGQLPHTRVEDIEIQYAANLLRIGTHGRGMLEAPIEVAACTPFSPDDDGDGICNFADLCPNFNNNLIGQPCDDGDAYSSGETYFSDCICRGGAANLSYCAAEGSSGTGSDYIAQVTCNTLDHASGKTMYSDFRANSTEVAYGNSYQLTVRLNYAFSPDRVHAWIDWNKNSVFDANELIVMTLPDANHRSIGSVSVPQGALPGATTMRVRCVYSTTYNSPCGSEFGEVEDYTVFVRCTDPAGDCGLAVLPLQWERFDAWPLGTADALLEWESSEEEELAHFEVERSLDGIHFRVMGQLPARNLPDRHTYRWIDRDVPAEQAYYRIAAMSFDGMAEYSAIRFVRWNKAERMSLKIHPNPVGNGETLHLNWSLKKNEGMSWYIYNAHGQEVLHGKIADGSNRLIISIDGLPTGLYLIRLRASDGDSVLRFLRQ